MGVVITIITVSTPAGSLGPLNPRILTRSHTLTHVAPCPLTPRVPSRPVSPSVIRVSARDNPCSVIPCRQEVALYPGSVVAATASGVGQSRWPKMAETSSC